MNVHGSRWNPPGGSQVKTNTIVCSIGVCSECAFDPLSVEVTLRNSLCTSKLRLQSFMTVLVMVFICLNDLSSGLMVGRPLGGFPERGVWWLLPVKSEQLVQWSTFHEAN